MFTWKIVFALRLSSKREIAAWVCSVKPNSVENFSLQSPFAEAVRINPKNSD
jgi:hypothetical protein